MARFDRGLRGMVGAAAAARRTSTMASSTRAWSLAFYALALFFNYPHYMATIYRAYHRAEDFEKYRIFTVHTTALIVLTLLLSHFWVRAAAVDLHHLSDVESMALQRSELRSVHDVRAARGSGARIRAPGRRCMARLWCRI